MFKWLSRRKKAKAPEVTETLDYKPVGFTQELDEKFKLSIARAFIEDFFPEVNPDKLSKEELNEYADLWWDIFRSLYGSHAEGVKAEIVKES